MISEIEIKNFKSLKHLSISAKPLNILMGLNGMGKSSLIQSLLLLHQSKLLEAGRLFLNDKYVNVGKGKDAFYQFAQNEVMEFSFGFNDHKKLEWKFPYKPESDVFDADNRTDKSELQAESLFNNQFQYLNAERPGPREVYATSYIDTVTEKQLGVNGEFVVHYLNVHGNSPVAAKELRHPKAKSFTLLHQTDAWLGEISPGVKLTTREIPGTETVLLDYQFETGNLYSNTFRPTNVGFGLSYVLPVIVALLSAQKERLIIIENPESHIHPRGQAELGKLISLAASTGAQLFIETHSDHILNGVRVATKNKLIPRNEVGIFFFDKITEKMEGIENYEQFTRVTPIRVDDQGELSDYPKNFLDVWSNQLLKLL